MLLTPTEKYYKWDNIQSLTCKALSSKVIVEVSILFLIGKLTYLAFSPFIASTKPVALAPALCHSGLESSGFLKLG